MRTPWILSLLMLATLAGCLSGSDEQTAAERQDFPYYNAADGKYHFQFDHATGAVHFDWAPGYFGKIINLGDEALDVGLPFGFLLTTGPTNGTFSLPAASFALDADSVQYFLAPPSATNVTLTLDGEAYDLRSADTNDFDRSTTQALSGEHVYELERIQHRDFPHRTPGQPNYALAVDYFADYYESLGYEVEVDPYGTRGLTSTTGACVQGLNSMCPESLANVVATKPGTDPSAGTIFVAGGHFDMVPQTTHAAFDDTSGTVATMELARALAPFEFRHTLKFAAWGGEENGILGSQFWIQSNPTAKLDVKSYWNLDVVGISWPAPLVKPDPIVIAAGVDTPTEQTAGLGLGLGPIAEALIDQAQELQQDWFAYPETGVDRTGEEESSTEPYDLWLYEGILDGQVAGYAGVNAQSDHTPFAAAGIPAYFIFNGDTLAGDHAINIHNERDTVWNMTKYAYYAHLFDLDDPTWESPEIKAEAEKVLAESWEVVMFFPFYHTILMDLGYFDAVGPQQLTAGTLPI